MRIALFVTWLTDTLFPATAHWLRLTAAELAEKRAERVGVHGRAPAEPAPGVSCTPSSEQV